MMVIARAMRNGDRAGDGHYCPHCLRRVAGAEAQRQAHRETCRSGALDVALLRCPTCGLVLSAEVQDVDGALAFASPPR
jgi:hypothetical protein